MDHNFDNHPYSNDEGLFSVCCHKFRMGFDTEDQQKSTEPNATGASTNSSRGMHELCSQP